MTPTIFNIIHTCASHAQGGGKNFFHPPLQKFLGFTPLSRGSHLGVILHPPKNFWTITGGWKNFTPPLNGQKIQFIPPKMAKKSIYTPQNEPKKFYPTLNFFLEISPPSPGRNFYPPLLATCSHMYDAVPRRTK